MSLDVNAPSVWAPVLYSAFAGSATAVGGAVVYVLQDAPSDAVIAFVLAFAAGVMSYVSVFDLYLPSASQGGVWPFVIATACTCVGMAATQSLRYLQLPEPEDLAVTVFKSKAGDAGTLNQDLLPGSNDRKGTKRRAAAWRLGLLLCLILSAHNFPEGVAVGVGSWKDRALGISLCAAIFIHNIAEGIVVAVPILAATGDRRFAFLITAMSGITEPIGAFIGVFIFRWCFGVDQADDSEHKGLLTSALDAVLCAVAGVMMQVSVSELVPQSLKCGTKRTVGLGLVSGAALIGLTGMLVPE